MKKIARSLVAFANTDGGRLLIGVKDNGNIAGVRSDEEYYMVESAAKIYSKPPIDFTTRQHTIDGKTILEVIIEPSKEKPHFAKDEEGKWWAYFRKDDENKLATKVMIEVWKAQNSPKGILNNYSENYLRYSREIGLDPRREKRDPASLYLQLLSEQGLIGFAAFIYFVFLIFKRLFRAQKEFKLQRN